MLEIGDASYDIKNTTRLRREKERKNERKKRNTTRKRLYFKFDLGEINCADSVRESSKFPGIRIRALVF